MNGAVDRFLVSSMLYCGRERIAERGKEPPKNVLLSACHLYLNWECNISITVLEDMRLDGKRLGKEFLIAFKYKNGSPKRWEK